MAMCLLAEMAYEHNEDLREHVPLLLHVLLTIQDSPEPIVYQHAQQALLNILYSLSTRHLESAPGQEGFQVCACKGRPSLSRVDLHPVDLWKPALACLRQEELVSYWFSRQMHYSLI